MIPLCLAQRGVLSLSFMSKLYQGINFPYQHLHTTATLCCYNSAALQFGIAGPLVYGDIMVRLRAWQGPCPPSDGPRQRQASTVRKNSSS